MVGKIIKINAGFYDIFLNGDTFRVRGSGKLRFNNHVPLVGDMVEFKKDGFLEKILERENEFVRPKVANIDHAIIVCSMVGPDYSSFLLNKMLMVVESKNIHPIILFTKVDLTEESHLEEYTAYGYEAYNISNKEPIDKNSELYKSVDNKVVMFMGQTGAGKSSTINNLTGMDIETQEISKALGRGKHTTRVVEMHPWSGGWLIDTPGFSLFDINISKTDAAKSFKSFKEFSVKCKFRSCIHWKEDFCNVKDMVKENNISKIMYDDYIKILNSIQQGKYDFKK